MILLLLTTFAVAKDLPGEELFVAQPIEQVKPAEVKKLAPVKTKRVQNTSTNVTSNIPCEYLNTSARQSTASELIQPTKGSMEIFRSLRVGDILDLKINHSVVAFSDEKSPIIAIAESGTLKGIRFIGESYLEPNTKRIFINFSRMIQGQNIYFLKGVGVSANGQPGLSGEYHSREAEYFAGDFVASFAAGYFDGLIPRKTNAFGQIETDTSVDAATKKGLASGALSTAERFREKLKKVPEFSEIKGPFSIQLLILDQAKSNY